MEGGKSRRRSAMVSDKSSELDHIHSDLVDVSLGRQQWSARIGVVRISASDALLIHAGNPANRYTAKYAVSSTN